MMTPQTIQTLRDLMEFEAARTEPPRAWPATPDIPAGRYVDPRFFALEQQYVWRKSWLLAAHIVRGSTKPGCMLTISAASSKFFHLKN